MSDLERRALVASDAGRYALTAAGKATRRIKLGHGRPRMLGRQNVVG